MATPLPVLLAATFVQLLDVTSVQVAAPALRADLDAGQGTVRLVLAGYTLSYACLLITGARLGDRFGYRRLLAAGLAVFLLGAAADAAAPSAGALVAARLVQGAGSGLLAPQVLALLRTTVPAARQPHALGLLVATMGTASLVGPLLGALLLEADVFGLGWRAVFLVGLPVGLAALAGATRLPATRGAGRQRVDAAGAALATAGLGLLILPLAVGRDAGWPAWSWACLAAGGGALAGFAALQRRPGREPLLHPDLLRDPTARTGALLVLVFNAGVPSFTYLLFLHLQSGLGYSPLAAGLTAAPFAAAAMLGSRAAPRLSRRRPPLVPAAATLAATMAALACTTALGSPRWALVAALVPGGAAFGLFTAHAFTTVLARAHPSAVGSVAGLLPTAQQLGGAVGITLAGLVHSATPDDPARAFTHALAYEAATFLLAAAVARRLTRPAVVPGSPATAAGNDRADPSRCAR
ncbi:MFS transporter [Streptomyces sp. NPDC127098]|uniref:MFS transporter n=1 Tax=Streptomyces sp. NPDC127098 TaxID=3347137 RepID=UPI00366304A1